MQRTEISTEIKVLENGQLFINGNLKIIDKYGDESFNSGSFSLQLLSLYEQNFL